MTGPSQTRHSLFSRLCGGLHIIEVGGATKVFSSGFLVALVLAVPIAPLTILLVALDFPLNVLAAAVVIAIACLCMELLFLSILHLAIASREGGALQEVKN